MKNLNLKMFFVGMVVILAGMMFLPATGFSANSSLNYKVTPLPKNASSQLKELLGKWQGQWLLANNEKLEGVVDIININLKTKDVILKYSWGRNTDYQIEPGGFYYTGKIETGKNPEIKFGKYARFKFVLRRNHVLEGTRIYNQYYTTVKMHKVK